jgi:DNA phosphorothioation-associated putative methyltransferase
VNVILAQDDFSIIPWEQISQACGRSAIGKRLPDAFYVHCCALSSLDPLLQDVVMLARSFLPVDLADVIAAPSPDLRVQLLIKFILREPKISFLSYPEFETDPHPALKFSLQVDLEKGTVQRREYSPINPPILHRKETFIPPSHPHFQVFASLTEQEERLGLLKQSRQIGTRLNWQKRLDQLGIEIHNHGLACSLALPNLKPSITQSTLKVDRHKAAIHRNSISKPVRLVMEAGLLSAEGIFFDYGCGHGGDVERLKTAGYVAEGWDPYYQPDQPWLEADIVNLGYILNVIEDPGERREALVNAWGLTRRVLIVAAQVLVEDMSQGWLVYGDGVITQRNTFQKYYEQEELKCYIDQVLEVDSVPIALGIYLVFRDFSQLEHFRANRFRSRASTPRVRSTVKHFEQHRSLLQPLMDFYSDRGRLPTPQEATDRADFQDILRQFSTFKQAFNVVLRATDAQDWETIRDQRRQDWLVYLALSEFDKGGKPPQFSHFDDLSQGDIKGLFGSYKDACMAANLMLFNLGNLNLIKESCRRSTLGLHSNDSLWIHCYLIEALDPVLRLYEGCGARTFGRPEGAVIIRLHWKQAAITYYTPHNFDEDPHPMLVNAMKIDLRSARVFYRDYKPDDRPPIVVRKDRLVSSDYPLYQKFAQLSLQEVKWGILDSLEAPVKGWTKEAWAAQLWERGAVLQGHRLVWRKDLDPYQRKLLESEQRRKQSLSLGDR